MRYEQDVSINHLVPNLKHAFAILPRLKGPFSAQVHNLLVLILGVGVGVAGLYVSLWDGKLISIPSIFEQKDYYTVAGLQNLGNNCFLNVILQLLHRLFSQVKFPEMNVTVEGLKALASSSCFLSFLQSILDSEDLMIRETDEKMPLTVALSSLLEELCIVRDGKSVLNPRRVMVAMNSYASSFNLTRQQDAAEAFLHLLSALEEEISECYGLHDISLADITAFPSKIYKPNREGKNECERWKQRFLGPFDGTIGSSLMCKSCSSMLSMDFEFFRCLPLSPVLDRRAEIMAGCTVVDCLKHFTAVEHVENYRCGRCWHAAALKYLSEKREKDEEKIKKLDNCINLDSCDCNKIFRQEDISWTGFSCASKQLSIARCPRILCIHLQRASMNEHGEFIKLQGHVSFPLLLDLFPFMQANVGQETLEDNVQKIEKQQPNLLVPQLRNLRMQQEIHMLPNIYRIINEKLSSEILSGNILRKSVNEALVAHLSNETASGDSLANLHGPQAGSISGTGLNNKVQVGGADGINSSKQGLYRLSSVVEHYGRPGSGHYAVYRRLGSGLGADFSLGPLGTAKPQWFYASDREVSVVSEETVFAAEASLLFYDIVHTNTTSDHTAEKAEQAQSQHEHNSNCEDQDRGILNLDGVLAHFSIAQAPGNSIVDHEIIK